MTQYRELLVAIDLSDESDQVLARASDEAQRHGARMSLVHVLKPFTHVYGGFGAIGPGDYSGRLVALEAQWQQESRQKVGEIAAKLGIPPERAHVPVGNPAAEIRRVVAANGIDLLVIGTHGRHGLGLLLGSTASAVLHGMTTDALVVRVKFD